MKRIILFLWAVILFSGSLFAQPVSGTTIPLGTTTNDFAIWNDVTGQYVPIRLAWAKDTLGVYNVTPEQYGSDGTATNDSTAFANMFAVNDTLKISLKPGKVYDLSEISAITGGVSRDNLAFLNARVVEIEMNNATIDLGDSSRFLTITTGSAWTAAAHTGFQNAGLLTAAIADTLFSTDFVEDSMWVGVDDPDDWNGVVVENDMLYVTDNSNIGECYVIDYLDVTDSVLYFKHAIKYLVDRTDVMNLRLATSGGKHFTMRNGKIKNGGFNVSGFETATFDNMYFSMDSLVWQGLNIRVDAGETDWNAQSAHGLSAVWNTSVKINNSFFDGHLIRGLGYNINVGMNAEVLIDKATFSNARHAVTTSTATDGGLWQRLVKIINSSASFSQRTWEVIPSNITAFDTHYGTDLMVIDNCDSDHAQLIAKLRGRAIHILNSRSYNTVTAVEVSTSSIAIEREIVIEDCELENLEGLVVYDNVAIKSVDLINNGVTLKDDAGGSVCAIVYSAGGGGTIDTLNIKGGEYIKSKHNLTAYGIYELKDERGRYGKVNIEGVLFENLNSVITQGKLSMPHLLYKNNTTNGITRVFEYITTDTADGFLIERWDILDSEFNDCPAIYYSSGSVAKHINNTYWLRNTFNNSGGFTFITSTTKLDSIDISYNYFNEFTGGLVGSGEGFTRFANNTVIASGTGENWIVSTASTVHVLNNIIDWNVSQVNSRLSTGAGNQLWEGNTIFGKDLTYIYPHLIESGSDFKYLKNTVFVTDAVRVTGFLNVASGATLTVDDNYFDMSGASNHYILKGVSGSTLIYGTNRHTGTSTPLDTTGVGVVTQLSTLGD